MLTDGRVRRVAPFAVVAVVGALTLLLPPYGHASGIVPVSVVCVALLVLSLAWMAVLPARHDMVLAPVTVLFVVLTVARGVSGGGPSGLAALVMLPVLWVVLHGTRTQLWVSGVLTGLVFIAPPLLPGAPQFDASDWRRGLLWSLVVLLVCPVLQRGVEQLRASVQHEREVAGLLESVLRSAVEHSVIATDLAGTITMFSKGSERMLGYRAADVVGKRTLDLLHEPEEIVEVAGELGVAPGPEVLTHDVPAGGVQNRRWTYRRSDGSTLRVQLSVSGLIDAGVHTGWVGVARDVTAEEVAQKQVTAAERRWRVLLDHLPDTVVMVVDTDLRVRVAVGAGLVGQGLEDAQGKTVPEICDATTMARLEPMFRSALVGGSSVDELRSSRTGAVNEVVVVPLRTHEGALEALVVARDVTLSRQREEEVRQARDRFERLLDESVHGMMLVDAHGVVTKVNRSFCAIVQSPQTDIVGHRLALLPFISALGPCRLGEFVDGSLDRFTADRTLRPGRPDELRVTVTAVALRDDADVLVDLLATVVDVSDHARQEAHLAHLAHHDALTGLANRRWFHAKLTAHLQRTGRDRARGALLMLDVDNFKRVNDTHGHDTGDQVLVAVADVLRARMRDADVVARIGGDEFTILLIDADRLDAVTVADDLVRLIGAGSTHPPTDDCVVTASIGVILIPPGETVTAESLIDSADIAMYAAKEAGRDGYTVRDVEHPPREHTGAGH
jgi:diguanylate cyclase (GGDEF)-like protein/PAS domain S-box-containing protein